MTNAPAPLLARAVESARHMVDSVCVVLEPRAYDLLPRAGLGMKTRVYGVPWGGFAATRTKLYEYASAAEEVDWVLMLDADDAFSPSSTLPLMHLNTGDVYRIPVEARGALWRWRWTRLGHLMRARLPLRWEGIGEKGLHEKLVVPEGFNERRFDGLVYLNVPKDGHEARLRADAENNERTYGGDADAIRARYGSEPIDTRAAFYYAQSLKDAGRYREAFDAFAHRARCECGHPEEAFWSKLWMGKIAREVGEDPARFYEEASRLAPERAEPYYALATLARWDGKVVEAYDYSARAAECAYPTSAELFVEVHCYSETALRAAGIDPS